MPSRSRRSRHRRSFRWSPWILLLALAAAGYQVWKGDVKWPVVFQEPPAGKAPAASTKVFEVLLDARLHDGPNNDGDSFKMLTKGQVHEFRLYFTDCPEKKRNSYNAQRLADQGRYFGGLGEAQTVAVGQQAQAFTQRLLTSTPFTVCTKWQRVFNSSRHYAFVLFPDGEDLSAKLVRQGLARIYTTGATLPDGRKAGEYQDLLRRLEAEARAARRGAWGMR